MLTVASLSRKISKEIDSQVDDPIVKELAMKILRFEMENWRMERAHFKEFFDSLITIQSKKRLEEK